MDRHAVRILMELAAGAAAFWGIVTLVRRRRIARMSPRERERYEEERIEREYQRSWASPGETTARNALILGISGLFASWALEACSLHDFTLLTRLACLIAALMGVRSLFSGPSRYSWPAILVGVFGAWKLGLILFFVTVLRW